MKDNMELYNEVHSKSEKVIKNYKEYREMVNKKNKKYIVLHKNRGRTYS